MGKSIIEIDKYLASVHDTVTLISRYEDRDGVSARSIVAKVNDKGSLAGLVYRMHGLLVDSQVIVRHLKAEMVTSNEVVNKLTSLEEAVKKSTSKIESLDKKQAIFAEAVETTKAEFSSYSECVTSGLGSPQTGAVNMKQLKSVVKQTVTDVQNKHDRSHNLMIFGLVEDTEEDTDTIVKDLLHELELQNSYKLVSAERVGSIDNSNGDHKRPIKAVFKYHMSVACILRAARRLRNSDVVKFQTVFITRDRTKREREQRNILVGKLRKAIQDNPNRYWTIKENKIVDLGEKIAREEIKVQVEDQDFCVGSGDSILLDSGSWDSSDKSGQCRQGYSTRPGQPRHGHLLRPRPNAPKIKVVLENNY